MTGISSGRLRAELTLSAKGRAGPARSLIRLGMCSEVDSTLVCSRRPILTANHPQDNAFIYANIGAPVALSAWDAARKR